MNKDSLPFRAEHIGSLLRPPELLKLRSSLEGDQYRTVRGSLAKPELKSLEDRFIADAVAYQEDLGFKAITDGDFRRRSWWQDFALALEGVQPVSPTMPSPSTIQRETNCRTLPW